MDIEKLFKKLSKEYRSHKFTGICLDSRNCKKGDLFLSIHGETKNGNQFINDAIKTVNMNLDYSYLFIAKKNVYDANYKMIKDSIFKDLTKVR